MENTFPIARLEGIIICIRIPSESREGSFNPSRRLADDYRELQLARALPEEMELRRRWQLLISSDTRGSRGIVNNLSTGVLCIFRSVFETDR